MSHNNSETQHAQARKKGAINLAESRRLLPRTAPRHFHCAIAFRWSLVRMHKFNASARRLSSREARAPHSNAERPHLSMRNSVACRALASARSSLSAAASSARSSSSSTRAAVVARSAALASEASLAMRRFSSTASSTAWAVSCSSCCTSAASCEISSSSSCCGAPRCNAAVSAAISVSARRARSSQERRARSDSCRFSVNSRSSCSATSTFRLFTAWSCLTSLEASSKARSNRSSLSRCRSRVASNWTKRRSTPSCDPTTAADMRPTRARRRVRRAGRILRPARLAPEVRRQRGQERTRGAEAEATMSTCI
mmetsp:Transcript_51733/g.168122  ORF Transcript_51733/g.168122 Transcript_51733/m.168122 type:complete len:312 (+) Transcript_51733:1711-2646(+)